MSFRFVLYLNCARGTCELTRVTSSQRKCFEGSLTAGELDKLKASVKKHNPIGVSEHGLTMEGFLFLQHFFIQKYVFAATRDTCQTCQTHRVPC